MVLEGDVLAIVTAVFLQFVSGVSASAGDGSWFFQKCIRVCWQVNCSDISGALSLIIQTTNIVTFCRETCVHIPLADLGGGSRRAPPPPYGSRFFRFDMQNF